MLGVSITALGGALVLGSFPRLLAHATWRDGLLLGLGLLLLATSRPYEGALFSLPFLLVLAHRVYSHLRQGLIGAAGRVILPTVACLLVAATTLLTYNAANTGNMFTAPYSLNRDMHAGTPAFLFQRATAPARELPKPLRDYYQMEGQSFANYQSPSGFVKSTVAKIKNAWLFYIGPILTLPFLIGLFWLRSRTTLAWAGLAILAGFSLVQFNWAHYLAPAAGLFVLISTAGLGELRRRRKGLRDPGRFFARALPTGLAATLLIPTASAVGGLPKLETSYHVSCCSLNPPYDRTDVERRIERVPGKHLVFVRSSSRNSGWEQWVFNGADIDGSQIVWAHDLGAKANQRLIAYYADRKLWLMDGLAPDRLRALYVPNRPQR